MQKRSRWLKIISQQLTYIFISILILVLNIYFLLSFLNKYSDFYCQNGLVSCSMFTPLGIVIYGGMISVYLSVPLLIILVILFNKKIKKPTQTTQTKIKYIVKVFLFLLLITLIISIFITPIAINKIAPYDSQKNTQGGK